MPDAYAALELDVSGFNASAKEAMTTMRSLKNGIQSLTTGMANLATAVTAFNILANKDTWKDFASGVRNVRDWVGKLPTSFKAAAAGLTLFVAGIYVANKAFNAFKNSIASLARAIQANLASAFRMAAISATVLVGALTGVGVALYRNIKGAIDFGAEMLNASKKAGIEGAGNLAVLEEALTRAGMSAKDARKKIKEFADEGRDFAELFESPMDFQIAMANAAKALGSQADVLNRSADRFKGVQSALADAGKKGQQFFLSLAEQVLPPLEAVLNMINEIDLGKAGADFGKALTQGAEVVIGLFEKGTLGDALKTAFTIAVKEVINTFAIGITGLANGFWSAIKAGYSNYFSSMRDILLGVANIFSGAILKGMAKAMDAINDAPAWVKALLAITPGGSGALAASGLMKGKTDALTAQGNELIGTGGLLGGSGSQGLADMGSKILDGFLKGFSEVDQSKILGTDADRAELKKIFSDASVAGKDFIKQYESMKVLPRLSGAAFTVGEEEKKNKEDRVKSTFQVVADSLAAVGGGGGFAQLGADVMKQQLAEQKQTTKATEKVADYIQKIYERTSSTSGQLMLA